MSYIDNTANKTQPNKRFIKIFLEGFTCSQLSVCLGRGYIHVYIYIYIYIYILYIYIYIYVYIYIYMYIYLKVERKKHKTSAKIYLNPKIKTFFHETLKCRRPRPF